MPTDEISNSTEPQPPASSSATEPELPPLTIVDGMPCDEWVDALVKFYREVGGVRGGDMHQLVRDTWSVFVKGADDEILDGYPPLVVTCVRIDIEKARG